MGILALRNETSVPAPAENYVYLYTKPDGKVYKKTGAGVETEVGAIELKTINGNALTGAGDITVSGGGISKSLFFAAN